MIGVISGVALLVAGWVWRQRVPLQNLILAEVLILLFAGGLFWGLQAGRIRGSGFPVSSLLVALAAVPTARLIAAGCCRSLRATVHYGMGLNFLAGLLVTLSLGLALRTDGLGPAPGNSPQVCFWFGLMAWSVVTLLITLPCWLDKRMDGPGRPASAHL